MEINITTISTPGSGTEVLNQALKCLRAVEENFNHKFNITSLSKEYEDGKIVLTDQDIKLFNQSHAVLSSSKISRRYAFENPEIKDQPISDVLNLYLSIKATLPFNNLIVQGALKEDLASLYEFILFKANPTQRTDVKLKNGLGNYKYNESYIEKLIHLAFRTAKNRKKKLTLVNPDHLEDSKRYWQNTVRRIGQSYPSVNIEVISIEKAVANMITKSKSFDILLSDYFVGNILGAESKVLIGTAELLPEAHDGINFNLFEPLVSFPKTLKTDKTNPMATIYATSLLLSRFGLNDEAMVVMKAVQSAINHNLVQSSYELNKNQSCEAIGDFLSKAIKEVDEVYNFNTENIGLGKSTII